MSSGNYTEYVSTTWYEKNRHDLIAAFNNLSSSKKRNTKIKKLTRQLEKLEQVDEAAWESFKNKCESAKKIKGKK